MNWISRFPFDEPRPFQVKFINEMVTSLESNSCTTVVAPNGFGKTICSLMAATEGTYDRIYYATRTHKQAENVIETIKMLNKKNGNIIFTAIELSGRDRSCINPKLDSFLGRDVSTICATSRFEDRCKCGKNKSQWLKVVKVGEINELKTSSVMDSTDLMNFSYNNGYCPYYLSIALQDRFNLVVCSYNHVFDPVVRNALHLDLTNSLVICDEGHNIINAMESFLTKELSTKIINKAKKLSLPYTPEALSVLKNLEFMLSKAENYFKKMNGTRFTKVKDVVNFLDEHGMTKKWAGWAMRTLKEVDKEGHFLKEIISFLYILMNDSEKNIYFQSKNAGKERERRLKVSSMEVKTIIEDMIKAGAKLVFMSGTLSSKFFKARIGVDMKIKEYKLPRRNLEIYIADNIPNYHKKLSSYFNDRGDEKVLGGFAAYISNVAPHVPGGMIAFFPSYAFRKTVIDAWEMEGYLTYNEDMERCFICANGDEIPIFIENRDDKTKSTINRYKQEIKNGSKALLLSVFRGGASEGEDFPGDLCRAVYCIGLPLRNVENGETKFKMNYYDTKKKGHGLFWLRWDAMMTVSQAVGRGIRDPVNDKAIAILMDSRYNKSNYSSLLCGWIRDSIVMEGKNVTIHKVAERARKFFNS